MTIAGTYIALLASHHEAGILLWSLVYIEYTEA